jgi:hypothetical protein
MSGGWAGIAASGGRRCREGGRGLRRAGGIAAGVEAGADYIRVLIVSRDICCAFIKFHEMVRLLVYY